jgi:hypothetical protein
MVIALVVDDGFDAAIAPRPFRLGFLIRWCACEQECFGDAILLMRPVCRKRVQNTTEEFCQKPTRPRLSNVCSPKISARPSLIQLFRFVPHAFAAKA